MHWKVVGEHILNMLKAVMECLTTLLCSLSSIHSKDVLKDALISDVLVIWLFTVWIP